jgi:hypothetical protein
VRFGGQAIDVCRLADALPLPLFQHDNAVALERGEVRPHRVRTQCQAPGEFADRRRSAAQFRNDTPTRSGKKPS